MKGLDKHAEMRMYTSKWENSRTSYIVSGGSNKNSLVHNGTCLYPNSRRHLLASCHLRTVEQWKVSSSWICTSVGPRLCRVLTVYAQTAASRKRLTRRRASGVGDKRPRGTRMLSCWQDKRPRIRSIDRSDRARIHVQRHWPGLKQPPALWALGCCNSVQHV